MANNKDEYLFEVQVDDNGAEQQLTKMFESVASQFSETAVAATEVKRTGDLVTKMMILQTEAGNRLKVVFQEYDESLKKITSASGEQFVITSKGMLEANKLIIKSIEELTAGYEKERRVMELSIETTKRLEQERVGNIQQNRDTQQYNDEVKQYQRIKSIQQTRDIESYNSAVKAAQNQISIQQRRDVEMYTEESRQAQRIKDIQQRRDVELLKAQQSARQASMNYINGEKSSNDENSFLTQAGATSAVIAGSLITAAIRQVSAAFRQGIRDAIDFQQQIGRTQALFPGSNTGPVAMAASNKYGVDLQSEAQANNQIALAGFSNDIERISKAGNELSVIFGKDLSSSVRLVTDSLHAYGQDGSHADEVTAELIQTIKSGTVDFDKLAQGLGSVEGYASQLGISRREVEAWVVTTTNMGLSTDKSLKSLQSFFNLVLKPSPELTKVITGKMGFASAEELVRIEGLSGAVKHLSDIAKEEGLATLLGDIDNWRTASGAILVAGDNVDKFTKALDDLKNKHASGASTAELAQQNAGSMVQRAGNRIKNWFTRGMESVLDEVIADTGIDRDDRELQEMDALVQQVKKNEEELNKTLNEASPEKIKEINDEYKKQIENTTQLRSQSVQTIEKIKASFKDTNQELKLSGDLWKNSYMNNLKEVEHEHSQLQSMIKQTANEQATFKEKMDREQFEESLANKGSYTKSSLESQYATKLGKQAGDEQSVAEALLASGKFEEAAEHYKKSQSLLEEAGAISKRAFKDATEGSKNFDNSLKGLYDQIDKVNKRIASDQDKLYYMKYSKVGNKNNDKITDLQLDLQQAESQRAILETVKNRSIYAGTTLAYTNLEGKALTEQKSLEQQKTKELERQMELAKQLDEQKQVEIEKLKEAKTIIFDSISAAESISLKDKDSPEDLSKKLAQLKDAQEVVKIARESGDNLINTPDALGVFNAIQTKIDAIEKIQDAEKAIKDIDDDKNSFKLARDNRLAEAQLYTILDASTQATASKIEDNISRLNDLIDKLRSSDYFLFENMQRPQGKAFGGPIGGFDRIPAMLSAGEFVMNAGATKKYYSQLVGMNGGGVRGYNTGGYVANNSFGNINVNVDGSQGPVANAKTLAIEIRRQLKRGTVPPF